MIKARTIKKSKVENRTMISDITIEKDNVENYLRENLRSKFLPHSKENILEFSLLNDSFGTLCFVPIDNKDLKVFYVNINNKKIENEVTYINISDIGCVVEEMATRFSSIENREQVNDFLNYWSIEKINDVFKLDEKNTKIRKR